MKSRDWRGAQTTILPSRLSRRRVGIFRALVAVSLLLTNVLDALAAENDTLQFFEQEAKVAIAAQHEQTLEQAPSIVTIVTRHDIETYGARDLADILRLIPGFEFGVDVASLVGLSFRGIWVHEGKSLLMIDGVPQNELGFGNYNFFGSIPASIIEKVEIIRGPGSAIYGGFAEANVISVITRRPGNLNGMRVSGDVGAVGHGGSSRYGNISYGTQTDALRVSAHVGYGSELLSTRDYTDFFGGRLPLNQDTAYRQWQHVITEASAKNLTVRYQRTSFAFGGQDDFTNISVPVNGLNVERFNNYNDAVHVDYLAKISDQLKIQPLFEYTRNNTFSEVNPASVAGNFQGSGSVLWRSRAEMTAIYDASWAARMTVGGGYIRDDAQSVAANGTPGLQLSANPNNLASRVHTFSSFGLFQYEQPIQPFNVTLGGRYEDTSFGNAFAPRAGLTYIHDAFNAKLLYGKAFRIPLPWQAFSRQFVPDGGLKPETADTTEMEFGYKFSPHVKGTINTFFVNIHQPIVYQGNTNTYVNFGRNQSQGVETELRADYSRYGGFANASYAVPGRGASPGFVTRSKRQFLGAPPLKVDLGTYYRVGRFEFSPSATYLSHRAGQSSHSANSLNGLLETTDYGTLVLANINIIARNVMGDLDVHLGVHNIFDTRYILIQPYYGAHAPLPAQDREIDLGAAWHF